MEVRDVKVRGTNFRFVCESWSNSRAWGHRVVIFENGREVDEAKIRYYNRTWECYTYQSCMQKVVRQLLEHRKERVINDYKYMNNISRLTQKKKEELIKKDNLVKTYNCLEEKIGGYQKAWI